MIRHVALFRLQESHRDEADRIIAKLHATAAKIHQIERFTVGVDIGENDGNYDIAVCVDFADREGYCAYRDHPEHLIFFTEVMQPHLDRRAAVQFEF
jgi:hypothetical protein